MHLDTYLVSPVWGKVDLIIISVKHIIWIFNAILIPVSAYLIGTVAFVIIPQETDREQAG